MLTQLSTLKTRLGIDEFDLSSDTLLTNALNAISVRFDKETNRTLARTTSTTQEFSADDTEICLACYPVESVSKFELKQNKTEGRIEQTICGSPASNSRVRRLTRQPGEGKWDQNPQRGSAFRERPAAVARPKIHE